MTTVRGITFVFLLHCGLTAAEADVTLVALDGPISSGVPRCIERFTGTSIAVSCTFLVADPMATEIVADVFLDGGQLGAKLLEAQPLVLQKAHQQQALIEGNIPLPLADIKKAAHLLVILRARSKHAPVWQRCGTFRIRLVPKDELKRALSSMATPQTPAAPFALCVFGSVPGLRELLSEWKIPFRDLGASMPPSVDAGCTIIGDGAADGKHQTAPPIFEHSSLFFLLDDPHLSSGLFQDTYGDTRRTILNGPLHPDWRESATLHRLLASHLHKLTHSHE